MGRGRGGRDRSWPGSRREKLALRAPLFADCLTDTACETGLIPSAAEAAFFCVRFGTAEAVP